MKNINEMKLHLTFYIKNDMSSGVELPLKTNGWYYPCKKTIKNLMIESTKKFRHSKIGQECLVQKIIDWKKEQSFDNLFFWPKGENIYGDLNKGILKINRKIPVKGNILFLFLSCFKKKNICKRVFPKRLIVFNIL